MVMRTMMIQSTDIDTEVRMVSHRVHAHESRCQRPSVSTLVAVANTDGARHQVVTMVMLRWWMMMMTMMAPTVQMTIQVDRGRAPVRAMMRTTLAMMTTMMVMAAVHRLVGSTRMRMGRRRRTTIQLHRTIVQTKDVDLMVSFVPPW